jgi:hypothetical protein
VIFDHRRASDLGSASIDRGEPQFHWRIAHLDDVALLSSGLRTCRGPG